MSFQRNPAFGARLRKDATDRLMVGAGRLRRNIQSMIGGDPPSEPGQPPAKVSGELQGSIEVYGPVQSSDAIDAGAGTDLIKGRFLEAGTASMKPRPYLLPSLLQSRDDVMDAMGGGGDG